VFASSMEIVAAAELVREHAKDASGVCNDTSKRLYTISSSWRWEKEQTVVTLF